MNGLNKLTLIKKLSMAKRGVKAGSKRRVYSRRQVEPPVSVEVDEIYSQQTDTLSAAIIEAYRNCRLTGYDELVFSGEIIAQGRYWHGL